MTMINVKYNRWIPITGELLCSKSLQVPVDFMVICLWATTGLILTALVPTFDAGVDLASILAAAEEPAFRIISIRKGQWSCSI